jgi:AcrR family transcriptional regulator
MPRKIQTRTLETRQNILTAAIKIFSTEGFARSSFQDIANSCGVSQAAVLHHFPNKEALFKGVIETISQHNYALVSEAFLATDNAYDKLIKYFRTNLMWGYKYPEEGQILLLLYYFATVDESFSLIYLGLLKNARLRLYEILLAGEREKLFSFDIKPNLLSEMLHDFLLGLFVNYLTILKSRKSGQFQSEMRIMETKWKAQVQLLTRYKK